MPLVNTVRGRSSAMTSESGSVIAGLSPIEYGRSIVERPDCRRYPFDTRNRRENDMKTVLITGCSSGSGLETARHFHARGWNVVATMRTPHADILPRSERMRVLPLDVTSPESIAAALDASGPIDALVNNAGVGLFGAFEATPMAQARRVFETNTFGVMAMTQAVLPRFRAQRSGVVVNVTSSATLAPMPLVAVYTASKTAIEGFTGSLAHELAAFNVRVKLVEPGYAPTTRFTQNTDLRIEEMIPEAYAPFAQPIFAAFARPAAVTTEVDVAEAVWHAANDMSGQLRFPAGPDAVALARCA
jgi:NAD(P)-dependent dehydrogenase (short-subunit alcohol dehydrogenase family)